MRALRRLFLLGLVFACFGGARAAPNVPRPYIAYLCAAGGKQGTTVRITVGGQNLRGTRNVHVTGEGVEGRVVSHGRVPVFVRTEVRREISQRLRKCAAKARREAAGVKPRQDRRRGNKKNKKPKAGKTKGKARTDKPETPPVVLPDHPLLRDMESLSPQELRKVAYEFLDPSHRAQTSSQIAEVVEVELTIDPDALPGDRELRLGGPRGLTNPVLFQVGTLDEFSETEPNDFATSKQKVLDLPVVINGQVGFKDLDRFRFRARAGQQLVIEAQARRLVPYLADAVPGWFQATLAIYDSRGDELQYGDDFRFDPDPVLFFEVPKDGTYELEIRDSIHRGREDFVYRITIAERPFITSMFPLGGPSGGLVTPTVRGWNLPWDNVLLDTGPGLEPIRTSVWSDADLRTNRIAYAVGDLPESLEKEPNDTLANASRVEMPRIVNGRIATAGEVDVYRVEAKAGDEIVAELHGRRLGSPIDSLIQVLDAKGAVLAWNDDMPDKTAGLVTHQADSYVLARLPAAGTYYVRVADAQGHGGVDYAYRLRLSRPRPDFSVIVTPASINMTVGSRTPITLHAVRKDGFEGDIEVNLKNAPPGFILSGSRIPAGRDQVRMTLEAPGMPRPVPVAIEFQGRALAGRRSIVRRAVPAENMMQAFGLRHLVAAQELLVHVPRGRGRRPTVRVDVGSAVELPAGGTTEVRVLASGLARLDNLEFELGSPPPGVTLKAVRPIQGGCEFILAADPEKAKAGYEDNLIIEVYAKYPVQPRGKGKNKAKNKSKNKNKTADKAPAKKKADAAAKAKTGQKKKNVKMRKSYIGVLPAIPIVIVRG